MAAVEKINRGIRLGQEGVTKEKLYLVFKGYCSNLCVCSSILFSSIIQTILYKGTIKHEEINKLI